MSNYFNHKIDSKIPDVINKLNIGLDVSINSTGLVIDADGELFLYLIVPEIPIKKNGEPKVKFSESIEYLVYDKGTRKKRRKRGSKTPITKYHRMSNNEDENIKIQNFNNILNVILKKLQEFYVRLDENVQVNISAETPSISSTGASSIDLPQLNFYLRMEVLNYFKKNIHDVNLYNFTPNELKKKFSGNGVAKKELMINTLKQHIYIHVSQDISGVDDIADAYGLIHILDN